MLKNLVLAGAAAAALTATPALAADFSFVGNLSDANQVLFFDFTVGAPSNVTLLTYSYAGGTNSAGATIARGGFDPILSLYDVSTGLRIGQNDDGGGNVPADAVTGAHYDTFFQSSLLPGNYRVAVTVYPNFGPTTLGGTFQGASSFNGRTNAFAFDVLNVDAASGGAVPEPAAWGMMLLGFGAMGAAMRRRSKVTTRVAYA